MERRISILCVDDHRLVREGIAAVVSSQPDMEVAATAANGIQAVELHRKYRPDVTLMDLQLPLMNGLEAISAIRAEDPGARIIVLTMYHGDEDIHRALQAGAATYLLKDAIIDDLPRVIREVNVGGRPIPPNVARILANRDAHQTLTPREIEVLELVAQGSRNKEIAETLGISRETVKMHVSNVLTKLDVQDRSAAIVVAIRRGIVHIALSLLLCLVSSLASAEAKYYSNTGWTRKEGLIGSQIWALAQDRLGYIWLGTNEGLVRFDGVRFLGSREIGLGTVPTDAVRTLLVAHDGALWVGFAGMGGVSRIA
ncbi:MAG TPA: response regulator, partial [Vicinamibacterales bacterium]|nr:response regulator [Vicinamibacterales bacterium]